jgi:hypothetical protein
MKPVRLLHPFMTHSPGEVVEVRDQDAVLLIQQGRAKYVSEPEKEPAAKMTTEKVIKPVPPPPPPPRHIGKKPKK